MQEEAVVKVKMKKETIKKKYTEKDYKWVLNNILESWADQRTPDTYAIIRGLKKSKKRMDEEYEYWKEMEDEN